VLTSRQQRNKYAAGKHAVAIQPGWEDGRSRMSQAPVWADKSQKEVMPTRSGIHSFQP
jgi:hypothetical protein